MNASKLVCKCARVNCVCSNTHSPRGFQWQGWLQWSCWTWDTACVVTPVHTLLLGCGHVVYCVLDPTPVDWHSYVAHLEGGRREREEGRGGGRRRGRRRGRREREEGREEGEGRGRRGGRREGGRREGYLIAQRSRNTCTVYADDHAHRQQFYQVTTPTNYYSRGKSSIRFSFRASLRSFFRWPISLGSCDIRLP